MKNNEEMIKCDFVKNVEMITCDREDSDRKSNVETTACSFKEINELNDKTIKKRFVVAVHDEEIITDFNIMKYN